MRVTEKGQVTIPKPIRDKLGIGPGSEVEFVERGEAVEVIARRPDETPQQRRERLQHHLDQMRGTIDLGGMTTDEFMDSLRGPRDDLDPR